MWYISTEHFGKCFHFSSRLHRSRIYCCSTALSNTFLFPTTLRYKGTWRWSKSILHLRLKILGWLGVLSPKLTTCTCQLAPVTKNTHLPSLVVFFFPKDGGWKINFSFWGQRNGLFSRARSLLSGSVTTYNQLVELFTSPTEQLQKKNLGIYTPGN